MWPIPRHPAGYSDTVWHPGESITIRNVAKQMEVIFDCFFEETFAKLERSGLKARQKRKDVIDHLDSIIGGCAQGLYQIFHVHLISINTLLFSFSSNFFLADKTSASAQAVPSNSLVCGLDGTLVDRL